MLFYKVPHCRHTFPYLGIIGKGFPACMSCLCSKKQTKEMLCCPARDGDGQQSEFKQTARGSTKTRVSNVLPCAATVQPPSLRKPRIRRPGDRPEPGKDCISQALPENTTHPKNLLLKRSLGRTGHPSVAQFCQTFCISHESSPQCRFTRLGSPHALAQRRRAQSPRAHTPSYRRVLCR